MEFLRIIFAVIWKCWFFLVFVITFLLFYPLLLIFLSKRSRYKYAFVCQLIISRLICVFTGLIILREYRVKRKEIPQPCVIIANHSSYLDIVFSYLLLSRYFVFVAKFELNKAPLFNIYFRDMQISVKRTSKMDSHKAFIRAAEELDTMHSVFFFPEGTISDRGELINFKNGPFKLAVDKQVPILPITFTNNWKLLQNGGFFKSYGRPGITRAIIHQPVLTKGMTEENVIPLKEQLFKLMKETLDKFKEGKT